MVSENHRLEKRVHDLLVVIVNWNGKEMLSGCLASLAAASQGLSVHTVVVDNASTDGAPDMVAQEFPWVELVRNRENLGFARANNLALRRHTGAAHYFLLLNPDTVVSADAFRRMTEFMDANPEAGIVGCKLVKPDGTLDWACKRSYITPSVLFYKALGLDRLFAKSPRFGRYQLTYLDENQIQEVDCVVGAFLLIRRECLEGIGLLDETLFMYGEDMDFCYRAKGHGWKVYYVPTTTVLHHKGQSTSRRSYQMIYYWYHSIWLVYRKNIAPWYSPVTNALVWAGFRVMCAVSLFANLFRRRKRVPSRL